MEIEVPPVPASMRLPATIDEAGRRLRDGTDTIQGLTRGYLDCIRSLQPTLNAFIRVTEDIAMEQAAALDAELRSGRDRGPLHGIPVVYKDNLDTRGVPTTVGSEFFRNRIPDGDAAIVRRLTDAGMVMLGKANQSEFSSGSSGVNVFYGNVQNPWEPGRAPGGSSSGTGAAVASGMALAGIGTDAGGSVRQPASRCGIFGLRPTLGKVSLEGVWPRTKTLGAAGPMTRCVKDAALMMNALVPEEGRRAAPGRDYTAELGRGIDGLRLAVIRDYTFSDIDPEVEQVLREATEVLSSLGAEIVTIEMPALTAALDYMRLFRNVLLYEFNEILGDRYRAAPRELFGPAVHSDIERGAAVSTGTYEGILRERPALTEQVRAVFRDVDALLAPVLPNVTPLQTEGAEVWLRGRRFNLPFSFAGIPAVSVPAGFTGNLPVGLQIVADRDQEALLLRISAAFENATDHHSRRPPVYSDEALSNG
jgi:aspartyl-tRNA(Asn)/glutamyl-tRNA(Gln) amidotransferase subunit A